jgi:dTDP-4-amino-4,6-dideoxygalactose transaminase
MVPGENEVKLTKPYVSFREIFAVSRILRSGNLTQGNASARFESDICEYVNSRYAFVTSSATTGLHLSLDVLQIGEGDEVIIPDFSFPATANSVIKVGATPICVDIDLKTFCLDPSEIEKKITKKTKAIMPVHAFGLCANMPEILRIAKKHKLRVIEDAACAIGSTIDQQHAGTFGDCGVYSFHPRKLITTGEGGAIVTNDDEMSQLIRVSRSHGGVRGELFMEFIDSGYNFRLSDINCAIGIEQLLKIKRIISGREKYAKMYNRLLEECSLLTTPYVPAGYHHTYQSYVVLLSQEVDRDFIIRELKKLDIETTLGTYSISSQPYFKKYAPSQKVSTPRSNFAFKQSLTLPLYPGMKRRDVIKVATSLLKILNNTYGDAT